jgi:hypothetical protein
MPQRTSEAPEKKSKASREASKELESASAHPSGSIAAFVGGKFLYHALGMMRKIVPTIVRGERLVRTDRPTEFIIIATMAFGASHNHQFTAILYKK